MTWKIWGTRITYETSGVNYKTIWLPLLPLLPLYRLWWNPIKKTQRFPVKPPQINTPAHGNMKTSRRLCHAIAQLLQDTGLGCFSRKDPRFVWSKNTGTPWKTWRFLALKSGKFLHVLVMKSKLSWLMLTCLTMSCEKPWRACEVSKGSSALLDCRSVVETS